MYLCTIKLKNQLLINFTKSTIMKLEIIIKKENVTLYHKSVTTEEVPSEVLTILKEVHNCNLEITRKD